MPKPSASRPRLLTLAWITCLAGLLAHAAGGQPGQRPASEALEGLRAQVRELRARLVETPRAAEVWNELITAEGTLASRAALLEARARGAEPDPAELDRSYQQAARRVAEEWIAAAPDDPVAHLTPIRFWVPPGQQGPLVEELVERFPDSAIVHQFRAHQLRRDGEIQAAGELLEDFLATHPDQVDAHRLLYRHRTFEGNRGRAGEVLDAWLDRFPGDPEALLEWLSTRVIALDPVEARRRVEEAVEALTAGPEAPGFCTAVETVLDGALLPLAARCYRRLLTPAAQGDIEASLTGLLRVAGQLGDWDQVRAVAAELPAGRRSPALVSLLGALAIRGECEVAEDLLDEFRGLPPESVDHPSLFRALGPCGTTPRVETALLEGLERAPVQQLSPILTAWKRPLPVQAVEAVLRARAAQGGQALWKVLDQLYAAAGATEKRIAHLEAWLAAQPEYQGTLRHGALTDLLVATGQVDKAIRVLDEACREGGAARDPSLNERLVNLLLLTGQPDRAEGVASRYLAAAEGDLHATRGYLFLARAALGREDLDTAAGLYLRFFDQTPAERWMGDETDEYVGLLLYRGDEPAALRFLEQAYEDLRSAGRQPAGRERYVAEQLAKWGRTDSALQFLGRALEKAPQQAELYLLLVEIARRSGNEDSAEAALRSLIDLDPSNPHRWRTLAMFHLDRGRSQEALSVIEEGSRFVGRKAPALLEALGRAHLEAGNPVEAIRALKELKEQQPDNGPAIDLLREAYRALGESESVE